MTEVNQLNAYDKLEEAGVMHRLQGDGVQVPGLGRVRLFLGQIVYWKPNCREPFVLYDHQYQQVYEHLTSED